MSRILVVWELGAGLGHLDSLSGLAEKLLQKGHSVYFAVRDIARAADRLAGTRIGLMQAPALAYRIDRGLSPITYAEVLAALGYGEARLLSRAVIAWRGIYARLRPDLLIANHAPTALLASSGFPFQRLVYGTGFECPADVSPLPSIAPGVDASEGRLRQGEGRLLSVANQVLRECREQPLGAVRDLFPARTSILCTLAELDPYFQYRDTPVYWGPQLETRQGTKPKWPLWPRRPRVFAYLRPAHPAFAAILAALDACAAEVIVVALGLPDNAPIKSRFADLRFVPGRVAMAAASSSCDLCVCHGGHGTTAAMLLAGKPMLLLPTQFEQRVTAHAVTAMGAALTVEAGDCLRHIGDSLQRLLTEESYGEQARVFAARYRGLNSDAQSEAVAAHIHALLVPARGSASALPLRAGAGMARNSRPDGDDVGRGLNGRVNASEFEQRFFYEQDHYTGQAYCQRPFALTIPGGIAWQHLLLDSDMRALVFQPPIFNPKEMRTKVGQDLRDFEPVEVSHFEGAVVTFIKTHPLNFGHWMHDLAPCFHLLELLDLKQAYRIHLPYRAEFTRQLLEILGFGSDRVIAYEDHPVISADQLIFIHVGNRYGAWAKTFVRDSFRRGIRVRRHKRRLYISRSDARSRLSHSHLAARKIVNEAEVIRCLRRRGFESLCLSSMPFREQVRAFAEAEFVISAHGSGLMNLLFSEPGTRVIQIWSPASWGNPAHRKPAYASCADGVFLPGLEIHDLLCADAHGGEERGNIVVDPKELIALLDIMS